MDPEMVERRRWYEEMYAYNAAKLEAEFRGEEGKVEEVVAVKVAVEEKPNPFASMLALVSLVSDEGVEKKEDLSGRNKVEIYLRPIVGFVPTRWVYQINSVKDPVSRLICFHGLGGSHLFFRQWGAFFTRMNVSLFAVCLPGRSLRLNDPPVSAVVAAGYIADALQMMGLVIVKSQEELEKEERAGKGGSSFGGTPVILFGHSLGGIVAYETAKALGPAITHLMVSASIAPAIQTLINKDRFGTKYFCSSTPDLMDRMAVLGGLPPLLQGRERRDLLSQLFVPIVRADFTMLEKYIASEHFPSLAIPITTLRGGDDKMVSAEQIEGWKFETVGEVIQYTDRGGHSYLTTEEGERRVFHTLERLCGVVSSK